MRKLPALTREARLARRQRLGRFSYGLSGAIFLIGAWDGLTSVPPGSPLLVGTGLTSGIVQIGALLWSRSGDPPERLANALAALGMYVSAIASMHHKTGIQYAYMGAGAVYTVLAWYGVEKPAHLIKGRTTEPAESDE